jgi:glycosyltransferase involved in cell wall biosynthesis
MNAPLPNPDSPISQSFLSRLLQTRRRLRELDQWEPQSHIASASTRAGPKVSIMLITYNHERYVAQALDSILRQKRDFDIEINVIDDTSTDSTQAIVQSYKERYPGLINCYFNARNVGHIATQLNTIRGFQTLRGQYFALLEGDDYWTDDDKLATQVAFLDSSPDFVACAHFTLKVFDDNSRPPEHFLPFKAFGRNRATLHDLVNMAGVFHLSSIVYRNVFGLTPPMCLSDRFSCEITINMTYGLFGDFYCLDRYMTAYRVHGGGVFSGRTTEQHWLFHLHGFRHFALYLGRRHWMMFARAMIAFIRYVLAAPKKGEVASLRWDTRAIFWLHLIVARTFLAVLTLPSAIRRPVARSRKPLKKIRRAVVRGPSKLWEILRRGFKKARKVVKKGRRATGQVGSALNIQRLTSKKRERRIDSPEHLS